MPDHIQIPDITPIIHYVADGSQTVFAYPFPIFASEDVAVYLAGAKQISGYTVSGEGETAGGNVTFSAAPTNGMIVTLSRELPIERLTDFIEGGDFSADAINTELDFLTAVAQQVNRANDLMLTYNEFETPANTTLPARAQRANKALGFDGDGNPIAVSLAGSMAQPSYTAQGTGAATRTSTDKFNDLVSIKDFGAVGDGLTDDKIAIQHALAAHDAVFVPAGTYLISGTISLAAGKSLIGSGQSSIIQAQSNSFNAIEIPGGYTTIQNLRIHGGAVAIKLFGAASECVQNSIADVQIYAPNIGVQLDGYTDTNKPCYWNNFARVLVDSPATHGFHLTKSGAGDTPNANRFHACRVYSHGANITGAGFYVEYGAFNNSFVDCEANVKGTAQGCFIIGAGSNKTLLINPFAESNDGVPNIKLESGSLETSIFNLESASDGAAIWDLSGGQYTAYNAGFPNKNFLQKTSCLDMNATLQRFDTRFTDSHGTVTLDPTRSIHLVSSFGGAMTAVIPNAADATGMMMAIKKTDASKNVIAITEDSGPGPDGASFSLGAQNDYVLMLSNGASWFILASNRSPGNTRFVDTAGTYDIDMAVDTYLLSSFGGALTARLPPANAAKCIGRTVTIKKTDSSSNHITVTEQGGSGPDQSTQTLAAQYNAITVLSDGGQWYIVNRL